MQQYTIKNDGARNIKFTGEVLGHAASSPDTAHPKYSRSVGRWTELTLYRTKGGKFVCEEVGHTQWQEEHDRHRAAVCDDQECVIEFFGTGWLAKELYEDAEIDCAIEIE